VAPKVDRDALEAELDGAGANWQLLNFGGRMHSFAEEETMLKGIAEFNAPAAHQTYRGRLKTARIVPVATRG
jgi:hypothetical protein